MTIVHITVLISCGLAATFIVLVIRRWRSEQLAAERKSIQTLITKSYIQRISGTRCEESGARWRKSLRLEVVTSLLLLLRGREREQLMQLAELDGLLDVSLALSRSWRRARRIDAIRILQLAGSDACIARLSTMMASDRSLDVRLICLCARQLGTIAGSARDHCLAGDLRTQAEPAGRGSAARVRA